MVQVAAPRLAALRDELGFTTGLAVWGGAGPTFVRFEETNDALIISGRPGSVMTVLTSSTGRVFGALTGLLGSAAAQSPGQGARPMTADLILRNGRLTTLDRGNPTASAVAVGDAVAVVVRPYEIAQGSGLIKSCIYGRVVLARA